MRPQTQHEKLITTRNCLSKDPSWDYKMIGIFQTLQVTQENHTDPQLLFLSASCV
jgi:hypothetical protein